MSTSRFPRSTLVLSALAVVLVAPAAHATGFLVDYGADQGQAAIGNPYSVSLNPGAMAGAKGTDLTLDGLFLGRQISFNRSPSSLTPNTPLGAGQQYDPTYVSANTGQANLFNILVAPYLGLVTDFGGTAFRLGIAGYVPFGGQSAWSKNDVLRNTAGSPGAYDGSQRWATISSNATSTYGTLALAYRFEGAHLGVGASASIIRTAVQDTRAHNADGSDTIIKATDNSVYEGRSNIDMSGIQVGAAIGVYWEPTRTVRVGLSYTSQPNFGTMRLSGTFHQWNPGPSGDLGVTKADLLQAYPDVIRAGITWRVASDAELRLDGSFQRWSLLTNQCVVASGSSCSTDSTGAAASGSVIEANVPRNFQDAVKVRLGGAYWVQPQTEIFASGAFETSPISTKYDDPLLFDSTRIYATLGARHAFNAHFYAMAAYTFIYLLPLTVTDSALGTYQGSSRNPAENGTYSSQIYALEAALGYKF